MGNNILLKTKRDYNIIASHFSKKRSFFWKDWQSFLKLVKQGDKVLDLGCGNGRLYQVLKDKKITYLGIDFSSNLLEIAKKKYPQADFRLGNIADKKTWQNVQGFDICFCLAVFHHFPTPLIQLKVLKLIHQSLKNNGLLVLSVWNLWQKRFIPEHLKQLVWKINQGFQLKWLKVPYKVSDGQKIIKKVDRFCYSFTIQELKNLVEKAGFQLLEEKKGANLCLVAKKIV